MNKINTELSTIHEYREIIATIDIEEGSTILNDISRFLESNSKDVRFAALDLLLLNKNLFERYETRIRYLSDSDNYRIIREKAKEVIDLVYPPPPPPPPEKPPCISCRLLMKIIVSIISAVLIGFLIAGIILLKQASSDNKLSCECEFGSSVQQKIVDYQIDNNMTSPREVCIVNETIVKVIGESHHRLQKKQYCNGKLKYGLGFAMTFCSCLIAMMICVCVIYRPALSNMSRDETLRLHLQLQTQANALLLMSM